ncbi:hypothetical protein [Novosphingobium humi]|uniref:hypothetical protein n=1 Tax=Novosphingobium humi TaxID=2282397 RepID=UPI0025AFB1CA|nr:hypothetical protein [Novosphingobium humi]WJS98201.1 hypothetical protein NYQ05_13860 [Novosphingobium humi]
MSDIALSEAQVIWGLGEGEKGPPVKVVGGSVKDDHRYSSSWGACNSDFNEADMQTKLKMLLVESTHLMLNEGIPAKAVVEALMVIPEYRGALRDGAVIRSDDDY